MPATFAHYTLFYKSLENWLSRGGRNQIRLALGKFSPFGLLGSNSPDFPIVAKDPIWEDFLHGSTASRIVPPAVSLLRTLSGKKKQKCLAWFAGYLSHMTGDSTVHPVVNLRAGPYISHAELHQKCAVHQDAYIFQRLGLAGITKCELTRKIVADCSLPDDRLKLDCDILEFWKEILHEAFPDEALPDFNFWFAAYMQIVDKFAEESEWWHIRVISEVAGLSHLLHLQPGQVAEPSFINDLPTISGKTISYDNLFDKAIESTVAAWLALDAAVSSSDPLLPPLSLNWNLNSGEIFDPKYIFW